MKTNSFDFELPEALIALEPAVPRDASRLLVVTPGRTPDADAAFEDDTVLALPRWLQPGDALVFNDTRVLPTALEGRRHRGAPPSQTSADQPADMSTPGPRIRLNLYERVDAKRWRAFARPARKLEAGDMLVFADDDPTGAPGLTARVDSKGEGGALTLAFDVSGDALDARLRVTGAMPLPPYIANRRAARDEDATRYQTVYARHDGSVAAPTAGLHFTPRLFDALKARDIACHFLTLHVGAGTFLPVTADDVEDHSMQPEWAQVSQTTCDALNDVRARGGRVVAVGSTALRSLETASDAAGVLRAFEGPTALFIKPGYRFRVVDAFMTNFHLPRSTLFMLVSAFAGLETMQHAYAHAMAARYRFYSFGDACLLFPSSGVQQGLAQAERARAPS
ncbi:MAG: tRNA preQ1(34) S-adenosylmethionine ribosyltransferase-isomerase QueA [Pseudomonadota bacterium]